MLKLLAHFLLELLLQLVKVASNELMGNGVALLASLLLCLQDGLDLGESVQNVCQLLVLHI